MMDDIRSQGIPGMKWGTKAQILKAEPTAEEVAKQKLLDAVQSIYENACFANDNQPNFYYREYEDVGLLAVYQAGLEAGRQERA